MDYFDGDHHSERDEQFGRISLRVLDLRPVCRVRKAQRHAAVGERDSGWVPDATLDLPIALDRSWHYLTDPDPFCVARWSRWVRRVHRCPPAGSDPSGYLDVVRRLLDNDRCDVLLPTHEHAWLSSVARERLGPGVGLAVASPSAFAGVQSKIEFARLLDEVGLRPAWSIVRKSAMSCLSLLPQGTLQHRGSRRAHGA